MRCAETCSPGTVEVDAWVASALKLQWKVQVWTNRTLAESVLIGTHNSAITTATYQLSQQMEVHAAAAHAKEKQELAEQRAELNKLHAQFLHNQAITNARVEELETSIKVILADYKILKERVDTIETVNLPESPAE